MRSFLKIIKTIRPFSFLFTLLLFLTISTQIFAASKSHRFSGFPDGTKGLGFLLGEPSVLRYSVFTSWKTSWAFSAGYSFNKVATASADYLWYFYNANDKIRDQDFWNSILFYAGGGLRTGFGLSGSDPNDSTQAGLRAIGGAEYIFINSPWALKIEVAPEFFLKGKSSFDMSAGIGFIYYFFSSKAEDQRPLIPLKRTVDPSEFD